MKILLSLFAILSFTSVAQTTEQVTVKRTLGLMGSRFEITVVAPNTEMGYINIEEAAAEIKRIERMISSWDAHSQTSQINANAGLEPVRVTTELFNLIERCLQVSRLTDGAFDISYASMDRIWKFDGSMEHLPTKKEIEESISGVGYQNIVLDKGKRTVFLRKKGMRIGFGAIGKGYAADKAKALLVSKGVKAGIINASGDLTTWGTKDNGDKWMVGISNPIRKDKVFSWLPIVESSVATSGTYEKYVELNGKKYSHIIDPRTGYPVSGIQSVSVFAKEAEMCDALATAVFIMGRETGINLIEQLGGVEVIVVDDDNKIHRSKGITFQSY